MTLVLRDSLDADIPAITAIYGHAVRTGTASFEYDPPDAAEMARRRADVLGKDFPYLVAELDGTVAGYAYANTYRTRPAYRFSVEDSIYMAPDRQGAGIGRQLLSALLQRCEALDLRLVIAVIGELGDAAQHPAARKLRLHPCRLPAECRLEGRTLARFGVHGPRPRPWRRRAAAIRHLKRGQLTLWPGPVRIAPGPPAHARRKRAPRSTGRPHAGAVHPAGAGDGREHPQSGGSHTVGFG